VSDSKGAGGFFDPPEALPRGQHGLSRDQVQSVQRERVLRAFIELLAEDGYAKLGIARVCERAGVSHTTFYELFSDKEDCMCAAYDRYIEVVRRTARAKGILESKTWRQYVEGALDAYFDVLAADPKVARGFLVEMHDIGARAAARRTQALRGFAERRMLVESKLRKVDPLLKARPFSVHMATIQVQRILALEALEATPEPDFSSLRAELVDWFVTSWYGEEPGGELDASVAPDAGPAGT